MGGAFASLSVILCVVLFGSLVPQGLPDEAYLERYGESLGWVFLTLGLDDVFRTRGFMAVGAVLFLQLCACTVRRSRRLACFSIASAMETSKRKFRELSLWPVRNL